MEVSWFMNRQAMIPLSLKSVEESMQVSMCCEKDHLKRPTGPRGGAGLKTRRRAEIKSSFWDSETASIKAPTREKSFLWTRNIDRTDAQSADGAYLVVHFVRSYSLVLVHVSACASIVF